MIYFNIQTPAPEPDSHHLHLVRRNLAIALDKNARLTDIIGRQANELIAQADTIRKLEERVASVGVSGWQTIERQRVINTQQGTRIVELEEALDSCVRDWQAAGRRAKELEAEKEAPIAENVRLTGQVHALLATIEAQL